MEWPVGISATNDLDKKKVFNFASLCKSPKDPEEEPHELPPSPNPTRKLVRQKTLNVPERLKETHSVNLKDYHDEVGSMRLQKDDQFKQNGIPNNLFDIRDAGTPEHTDIPYVSIRFREPTLGHSNTSDRGIP
jgi:hypothetical protein